MADLAESGIALPENLQRMRHVRFVTADDALIGHDPRSSFATHIGSMIIGILRCMENDEAIGSPKILDLVVHSWDTIDGMFNTKSSGRTDRCDAYKNLDMAKQLVTLRKTRTVNVWHHVGSGEVQRSDST